MLNDKWVSIDTIIERIGRSFPGMAIDRFHVAEWCFEVVKEAGIWPGFKEERGLRIEVVNGRAELPCNTYRVLSVLPDRTSLSSAVREAWKYQNHGTHIDVMNDPGSSTTHVAVDLLVFEVDESGLPMVYEPLSEACYYYVLKRSKEPDFLSGHMAPDRWQYILSSYSAALGKARSTMRFITREDLDGVVRVARSIIRPTHYAANR